MKVKIKSWNAVASWRWDLPEDDVCGICQIQFDGACSKCRYPGDDCTVLSGKCGHNFHMHCIAEWIKTESSRGQCPMCRQKFEWDPEPTPVTSASTRVGIVIGKFAPTPGPTFLPMRAIKVPDCSSTLKKQINVFSHPAEDLQLECDRRLDSVGARGDPEFHANVNDAPWRDYGHVDPSRSCISSFDNSIKPSHSLYVTRDSPSSPRPSREPVQVNMTPPASEQNLPHLSAVQEDQIDAYETPPFAPIYTLVTNTSTRTTHHPHVHYIFSDDDPDILTRKLADQDHANLLESTGPSKPNHAVILDLEPDTEGNLVVSHASSLSPSWAVLDAQISKISPPSSDGEGAEPTTKKPDRLMLRIEGVDGASIGSEVELRLSADRSTHGSASGSGSGQRERDKTEGNDYGTLVEEFKKRLSMLRKVVDTGERRRQKVEAAAAGDSEVQGKTENTAASPAAGDGGAALGAAASASREALPVHVAPPLSSLADGP